MIASNVDYAEHVQQIPQNTGFKHEAGLLNRNHEKGFTLIELSLAMTFLAFIMLFLVTMILQMINIYNKSVSLSQMNQAGRQIMSDLNNGARFSNTINTYEIGNGRLCVGGVSYIWNTGTTVINKFSDAATTSLRLVRVQDPTQVYCNSATTMPPLNSAGTTVIVGSNVLVQSFSVTTGGLVPSSGQNGLIRVNVVLSTSGNNAPTGAVSNLRCGTNNFCAFATYNFIIYQRGM